jgi:hypothetical protein
VKYRIRPTGPQRASTSWSGLEKTARRGIASRVWDASRLDDDVTHFADRVHLNAAAAGPITASLVRQGFFDVGQGVPARAAGR